MLRLRPTLLAKCRPSALLLGFLLSLAGTTAEAAPATNQVVQTGPNSFQIGSIHLNRSRRTLTFPAEVRITNEVVEYALVTVDGKTHESILTTEASPTELHVAVLLLGVKPATNLGLTNSLLKVAANAKARIDVEWNVSGRRQRMSLEQWILLRSPHSKTPARRLKLSGWIYSGSFVHQGLFVAQEEGSIISLIRDPVALINNSGVDRDDDDIHFPDPLRIPPKGTPVTVRIRF